MSEQEFDRVIETGRRNQQAKALLANHRAHARLELPDGTSMAGSMLGLDIGMAWVRCQHAPMPTTMSMHGLDLAVAFYEQNCRGCRTAARTGCCRRSRRKRTIAGARRSRQRPGPQHSLRTPSPPGSSGAALAGQPSRRRDTRRAT